MQYKIEGNILHKEEKFFQQSSCLNLIKMPSHQGVFNLHTGCAVENI